MGLYLIMIIGSALAGFIGTLAGLASVLTLYLLIDVVQLDPTLANGTNRIGVLAMALMALPTFYKKGHLDLNKSWPIIMAIFIGSLGGFWVAIIIDNHSFKEVFRYLLLVMLLVVLYDPKKWVRQTEYSHQMNLWIGIPVFLVMGFYAGFIQLGIGVFLVIFLALVGKYSLVDANGIKLAAFALYTTVGICIFAYNDRIDWEIGGMMAFGQGIGAYIAARFATTYPNSNGFVRYLLIIMLVVAIIKMFKLYEYVM